MSSSIERRLLVLEDQANQLDDALRLVVVEDGETLSEALMKTGCPTNFDARRVVALSPLDVLL